MNEMFKEGIFFEGAGDEGHKWLESLKGQLNC